MKCRFCKKDVRPGTTHHCSEMQRAGHPQKVVPNDEADNFFLSAAISAATDSALLGGIVGGSFTGGVVGDLLNGDLMD